MNLIENAVSLAEVAKATKQSATEAEAEARSLGLFVGTDWAVRAAVSVIDARALVDGTARRDQDHAARWRAHQDATEAWEAQRMAVYEAANTKAYQQAQRTGVGSPATFAAQKAATRAAVERFEAANPPPVFDGVHATGSRWFNKIKEAVR